MIKAFKIIALLEGISYLLLLFIATPLKYFANNDTYVKQLGMPHGLLAIAYLIFTLLLKKQMKWDLKTVFIILICSVIPFGTFWMHKKYLSNS